MLQSQHYNRPEIAFSVTFSRAQFIRFSTFKNRFWRREWKKNSGKNSRCSSHMGLSIELLKFEFRALGGPESRGL